MRTVRHGPGPAAQIFSLTGILRCPRCGSTLHGKWTKQREHERYRYYFCARRESGGPETCDFRAIHATPLQEAVWTWLHEIVASPDYVAEHVERMQKRLDSERPDVAKRIAALRRQRDTLKRTIDKYFTAFEESPGTDTVALDRVRALRAELQGVEAELGKLEASNAPAARKVSVERVQQYLAQLRERIVTRADYQRALFQELRRSHDFRIQVSTSGREFTLSLALRSEELTVADSGGKKLVSVLASAGEKGDAEVCGKVNGSKRSWRGGPGGCGRSGEARSEM